MNKHLIYLKYVIKHKWYVMIECFKVGLYWQGITHDLSKFSCTEWFVYVNVFGVPKNNPRDKTGEYNAAKVLGKGWKHHQRNKHHWQAWVSIGNGGTLTPLDIPEKYLREMLCDMIGASLAQGKGRDVVPFYEANKSSWVFNEKTREEFELLLYSDGKK